MPHQAPLHPGDPRRVGRYRLAGRITGIPAEGPIYLGTGPDGTAVMVSVLRSDWTQDGAARDRFAAEAAAAKRVPPFCAARILDAGLDGADAYLISEYVPGKSLLEVISAEGILGGTDLEAVAIGMATGLASVHQAGLVHGSFGPAYVVMTPAGPRVVEFGITPPYGAATPAADMASWAQTVVFAASGRPPVTVGDLHVLPQKLRNVVADCLNPDPAERPAARAAVQELIGERDPPAGVLAEGSRRAVPGSAEALLHQQAGPAGYPAPWPDVDRSGRVRSGAHGTQPVAGPSATVGTGGQAIVARPDSSRPPGSRHGRGADESPDRAGGGYGGGQQPDRHVAHHQHADRRRTGPLVAGGVVVCALILLAIVRVLQDPGSSHAGASAGPSHTPRARTPLVTPAPSATVPAATPAAFAGDWSGHVHQPPTDLVVTVTFTKGASAGTVTYTGTDLSCSGALDLTKVTSRRLTFSQGTLKGQSICFGGTVTITLTGSTSVWFSFRGTGPAATGTLTKT
jgi:hypothetical protein